MLARLLASEEEAYCIRRLPTVDTRPSEISYHSPMRRLVLIVLMMLVPLQAAWAAGHAAYGHHDGGAGSSERHILDHGHDGMGDHTHAVGDELTGADSGGNSPQAGNGHHGCHLHPAFSVMLPTPTGKMAFSTANLLPPHSAARFASHTPPLFDRPPADRI